MFPFHSIHPKGLLDKNEIGKDFSDLKELPRDVFRKKNNRL